MPPEALDRAAQANWESLLGGNGRSSAIGFEMMPARCSCPPILFASLVSFVPIVAARTTAFTPH
jgi:hypothetical protein